MSGDYMNKYVGHSATDAAVAIDAPDTERNIPRTLFEATLRHDHHLRQCQQCSWVHAHPYSKKSLCEFGSWICGLCAALAIAEAIHAAPAP